MFLSCVETKKLLGCQCGSHLCEMAVTLLLKNLFIKLRRVKSC